MDCNGQHFRMISRKTDFESLDGCVWDEEQGRLRLDSRRVVDFPGEREDLPFLPGATHDRYGTWAWVAPDFTKVLAAGAFPTPDILFEAEEEQEIVDLAHGEDDVLYLLLGARGRQTDVALLDRRERWRQKDDEGNWQLFTLHTDDFHPDVVKPAPGGGAYLLDRSRKTLGIIRGLPLSAGGPLFGVTFRPVEEDADPPRLRLYPTPICDAETRVAAFAASPDGKLAFLLWPDDPLQPAAISIWRDGTCELPPAPLAGCFAPFDIGWLDTEIIGVLVSGHPEAIAFSLTELSSPGETLPEGERYPLAESAERRFFNSLSQPVSWPMTQGAGIRPRPLHPLSLSAVSRTGSAVAQAFDSRTPETEWHRLYLEAVIPRGTHVRLVLTAADDLAGLETAAEAVHLAGGKADGSGFPTAAWLPERSEIPYHQGLLGLEPQRPYVGLYTVLVQRTGTVVRSVRGRFLRVRVELAGGGAATPAIAAIRIYAPRFSYLDRYLPELYRETVYGADADKEGAATGSDFLKRFLGLFESFLTPLEDRIAASYLLTLPETAPVADLERLSSWIGLTLLPGLPQERKRKMLKQATNIQRMHGTLPGLKLALDCVTGGLVTCGDVVIIEDFIFRRVFATILGIDLGGEYDPLLAGVAVSGNSFIGKTLILGDEEKREFLSLFRVGDHVTDSEDAKQIADFFDLPAFRVTVLVHHDVDESDVGFIRRIVETEVPAHVAARVISASKPLLVGLTGLIGIESYIEERPPMPPVKLGDYTIGRGGAITSFGTLDGRFGA